MRRAKHLQERAREMRSGLSLPEALLWKRLRPSIFGTPNIRRQIAILPGFIADFYCPEAKLVIEVDGAAFHEGEDADRDEKRDALLRDQGLNVLRIPARTILKSPDFAEGLVREKLEEILGSRE